MSQTNNSFYERLLQAKLLSSEKQVSQSSSLWYITLLQAFSGWVAALFFVLFVAITFGGLIDDSAIAFFIIGVPSLIFAYKMLRSEQSEIWEHFALAISMTGQVMVTVGFSILLDYENMESIALFVALFQAFLVWKMPNYIHRLLSTLFMSSAFAYFFYSIGEPSIYLIVLNVTVVWIWLHQFTLGEDIKRTQAISYGLLLSFLWFKIATLYSHTTVTLGFDISNYYIPNSIAEIASGIILLSLVWRLLKREYQVTNQKIIIFALGGALIFSLLSMKAIGLTTAVTIVILGFATSHRLLFVLGIISLLFFISNYYYFTGVTLLDKAYILAIVGVALLLARWATTHLLGDSYEQYKEDNDA